MTKQHLYLVQSHSASEVHAIVIEKNKAVILIQLLWYMRRYTYCVASVSIMMSITRILYQIHPICYNICHFVKENWEGYMVNTITVDNVDHIVCLIENDPKQEPIYFTKPKTGVTWK